MAESQVSEYWGRDDLVSAKVRDRFPEAVQEIRWAGSSYCASLYTASVFHSMRAAEGGTRTVAAELGISVDGTENMKNVIDAIRTAANKTMEERKTEPLRNQRSKHYSEIAIDAGLFKDAWRNYVAHSRVTYDKDQALTILKATCRFFEGIVKPIE